MSNRWEVVTHSVCTVQHLTVLIPQISYLRIMVLLMHCVYVYCLLYICIILIICFRTSLCVSYLPYSVHHTPPAPGSRQHLPQTGQGQERAFPSLLRLPSSQPCLTGGYICTYVHAGQSQDLSQFLQTHPQPNFPSSSTPHPHPNPHLIHTPHPPYPHLTHLDPLFPSSKVGAGERD